MQLSGLPRKCPHSPRHNQQCFLKQPPDSFALRHLGLLFRVCPHAMIALGIALAVIEVRKRVESVSDKIVARL